MRKFIIAATAVLSLAFAGVASATVVPVTALPQHGFSGTNYGVGMTDYGVHFDVGQGYPGGDVKYVGFQGKLKDLTDLAFTARYNTATWNSAHTGTQDGNTPAYLRVYFKNGYDAIYDTAWNLNSRGTELAENVDHTFDVLAPDALWRYDDDCGNRYADHTESDGCMDQSDGQLTGYAFGAPLSKLLAEHGNDEIAFIAITQGWQWNDQNQAMLTRMRVNGDEFIFGAAGLKGEQGEQGQTGATGAAGKDGAPGQTTVITQTAAASLNGAAERSETLSRRVAHLRITARKRAVVRGLRVTVEGKTAKVKHTGANRWMATVDLRGLYRGCYVVRVTARVNGVQVVRKHFYRVVYGNPNQHAPEFMNRVAGVRLA